MPVAEVLLLHVVMILLQEAIYSGMKAGIRSQDSIITSYRAHGFTYVMGVAVQQILAELTGASQGVPWGWLASTYAGLG